MNHQRLKAIYDQKGYISLDIKPGQYVEIHENLGEGDNKRIWKFKGLIIKVQKPQNPDGSFTVRGESSGMVIEKVYPLSYMKFEKVVLLDEYKIRRSKLYYIREKVGKDARFKSNILSKNRNKVLTEK